MTLSAFMQCYARPRAVYEALSSFRAHYPEADISFVSDNGQDFSAFARKFNLRYTHAAEQVAPGGYFTGKAAADTYLNRMRTHCETVTSDWVVLLEEDVMTKRRALQFPPTACAGARSNPVSAQLNKYFNLIHGTTKQYCYGLCGGGCFSRELFLDCCRRGTDMRLLNILDDNVYYAPDVFLTCLFLMHGYQYSEWAEVSELTWPRLEWCVMRDAAFDHHDKRYYDAEFDPAVLEPYVA
jgi:hypothetical protein